MLGFCLNQPSVFTGRDIGWVFADRQHQSGVKAALPADAAAVVAVAAVGGGGCRTVLQQTLPGLSCHSSGAAPVRSKPRLLCYGGKSLPASGLRLGIQRPGQQKPGRRTGWALNWRGCSHEAGRMSGRRREEGMWAAASRNHCLLFGHGTMTSQTAVPETTENNGLCPNSHSCDYEHLLKCHVWVTWPAL